MHDNEYRQELDRIRLTEESKRALTQSLRRRQMEGRPSGWPRRAGLRQI